MNERDRSPIEGAAPDAGGGRGPASNQTGCLIAAGIVAAGLVVAAFILAGALGGFGQSLERANPANTVATAVAPRTPTVVVRPPSLQQVRALADLTTVQTLMSSIVEADQARVGNILYEKLVLLACGRVKAGIDLSKLKESDITVSDDGKTVRVRLPKAEVLDAFLVDEPGQPCTTKVYDRTNLIVLPASRDLESVARERAVKTIRDTAVQSGILAEADRNARAIIERLLLNAGFEKVEFSGE